MQASFVAFINTVLDLEDLAQAPREEFDETVLHLRRALIAAFSEVRSQALSIVPALTRMMLSTGNVGQFLRDWNTNRRGLYDAIIACPAFHACRWMLLPEEGLFEMVDAKEALADLVEQGGDQNDFDGFSRQCTEMLNSAFDRMMRDGYEMDDIEGPYDRCLLSLASDAAFIAYAGASYAALREAMRNAPMFSNFNDL